MQLVKLELKNFRCFENYQIGLTKRLVVIEGDNGAGKTSLLEALHYLCYMRSFRTHSPKDLVQFGSDSFFIKASFLGSEERACEIQVGFSGKKKLVKINQKSVDSYKELLEHYRIITISEDDLGLIGGGPEQRRTFLDHTLMLDDPDFLPLLRQLRQIVERRTAFLARGAFNSEEYILWTEQLWHKTALIQSQRHMLLEKLEQKVMALITELNLPYVVGLRYAPKKSLAGVSFNAFMTELPELCDQEKRAGYTLFGAHLDDVVITLQDKRSKVYASRGQQKLLVLLLKIAQFSLLVPRGVVPIFLLDDFMTDFDEKSLKILIGLLLSLDNQLIFTLPARGPLWDFLVAHGAERVSLV